MSTGTARGNSYVAGAAMILLAGGALSTGGVIIRHIDGADGWQILFYRSLAVFAAMLVVVAVRYRGAVIGPFRATGRHGVVYALGLGMGAVCFVQAITLTEVANVVAMIAITPLLAALAGRVILREPVHRATWIAIAVAIVGIAVMIGDAVEGGGLKGNLIALGVPASTVIVVMVVRTRPHVDMMPATAMSGVVAGAVGAAAAGSFDVPSGDIGLSFFMGFVQIGIGFTLLSVGARYVPAADAGLYALAEVVLAPIWVWIVFSEVPTTLTFVGGGIMLTAVYGASFWRLREDRRETRMRARSAD